MFRLFQDIFKNAWNTFLTVFIGLVDSICQFCAKMPRLLYSYFDNTNRFCVNPVWEDCNTFSIGIIGNRIAYRFPSFPDTHRHISYIADTDNRNMIEVRQCAVRRMPFLAIRMCNHIPIRCNRPGCR